MKTALQTVSVCGALLLAALAAGCGQLKVTGAPDSCPAEEKLTGSEAQKCWNEHKTVLTTKHSPPLNASRDSRLHGEPLPIAGRRLRQAVALDYSGSMYGGYNAEQPGTGTCGWHSEPSGRRVRNGPYYWEQADFAQLLRDGVLGALNGEDVVYPIVFNRNVTILGAEGSNSTFDAPTGHFAAAIPAPLHGREEVLRALTSSGPGRLPANPGEAPYSDPRETHLNEVLDAGASLFESFKERDGVLWIVTDNIIEQAAPGDHEVLRDVLFNQRFYETLKNDPRWQVIHAWPIHQAPWLCGSTLMVYGLYYSSRTRIDEKGYHELCNGADAQIAHARQIDAFQRYANAASPAPGQPFKLKPEDIDVVELSFVGQVICGEVKVGLPGECRAQIKVENLLNHRQVDSADIVLTNGRCDPWGQRSRSLQPVRIAAPFCARSITKQVSLTHPILPGHPETRFVSFPSPPVRTSLTTLADRWESASFDRFLMLGRMNVGIRNLKTSMIIRKEALKNVYGVDSLPTLFSNPSTDNLQTSICLPLSVQNPSYFASLVLFVLIVIVTLFFATVLWLLKPSFRTILIDDVDQGRFRMTRLGGRDLVFQGQRIGRTRLGWDGSPTLRGADGHKIQKRGTHWIYYEDGTDGVERRVEIVSKKGKPAGQRRDDVF